jgi:cell wall-associated NlpC family hydrolase
MRIFLLLTVLLLSACGSSRDNIRPHNSGSAVSAKKVTSYAKSLVGAPYKYGGNSPDSGFDCSGFVGHVFRHTEGIKLPRNTRQISRHGSPVKSSQLRPGDLVFYETNRLSYSHVGIYLGNDRFIHAPSSGGKVRVEDMNLSYWKKHYNGARRLSSRD